MQLFNKADSPNKLSVKEKIKFLFRDSLFFGGLRAVSMIFPILTIPILTRYFSVENYGVYDSLIALSTLVASFLVFGQDSAVARWFYQVDEKKLKQKIVSESLIIQLIFTILIIPLLIIYRNELANFYLQKTNYGQYILLILIFSFLLLLNNYTINILKWTYERKKYAILSILKPLLILSSLLLVIASSGDLIDFLTYNNIALIITNILGFYFCRKWIIFPKKLTFIKKMFYYGAPLGILSSTASFLPVIQRNMITFFLDLYSLGIYALAFKISAIVVMIDGIFHMAWGPFSMSIFKEKDAEYVYNLVLKIFFIVIISAVFIINLSSPLLIKFFGTSEYFEAKALVLPLSLALMINGITGITGTGISLSMKSYLSLIPFTISATILTILLYYLIPIYNLEGVALSILIANSMKMLITSYIAKKVYKKIRIKYELTFIFYLIFGILFYCLFTLSFGIITKLFLLCSTFPLIIFLFFNKDERDYVLKKFLNK
tara:strand:- start:4913 stop:6382 length:1470 start_codon:yes stop_codon:yes gene_type:complete